MLNFPFWMTRLKDSAVPTGNESLELQPFAFYSPRKLAAYLAAQNVEHWQLHLVTRYSAVTYLTELKLLGYPTIHVNSDEDGSGGTQLQIDTIIENLSR